MAIFVSREDWILAQRLLQMSKVLSGLQMALGQKRELRLGSMD
jgi:hypothetical protein